MQIGPSHQAPPLPLRAGDGGKRLPDGEIAVAQMHRLARAAVQAGLLSSHGQTALFGGRPLLLVCRRVGHERQDVLAIAAHSDRLNGRELLSQTPPPAIARDTESSMA